jgi:transcriptional regulator of acetoin/glycerol metabolism/DNA-binding CsgD family transcriptional regulator
MTGGREVVDLRDALELLVSAGDVVGTVREEIGASWRRSAGSGLTPDHFDVPHALDVDVDGALVGAAGPVLDQLAEDLAATDMALVLSDAAGQVLVRRVAERPLEHRLDRILLAPGFLYAEARVGTNAIGTALEQRRPSIVEGGEHFADALTAMTCAAAPIADPRNGRIIGAVDLTCRAGDGSPLMLALAMRAAREIEERLVDGTRVRERMLLQRFLRERRGAKGPLVLVNDFTMITNAAADRVVDPQDRAALWECAQRLTGSHQQSAEALLHGGRSVVLRSTPVLEGGVVTAAVLRLEPSTSAISDNGAPRVRRPYGWESLTPTERSVTELVADGLTNRQAAERLFLSPHTVGFHLRAIFRKLDVSSRVDLARLVVQRGPAASDD